MRWSIAATAASALVDGDGVGGAAQRAGDGGLVAAADGQQRGHRAEQPGDLVGGGEQRAGAVLAVEAELEGVLAGGQRRRGRARPAAPPRGPWPAAPRGRRAAAAAASCSASRPSSPASRPATRVSRAVKSRWARAARASASSRAWVEAADLVVGGGGAGAQRVDLAVQPGQPLAAVGGGAVRGRRPGAPPRRRRPRRCVPGGDRLLEGGAVRLDLGRRSRSPARAPARPRPPAASGSRPVATSPVDGRLRRCGPARRPATGCRAAARAARTARTRSPAPGPAPGRSSRSAASRPALLLLGRLGCWASTSSRRATSTDSSASSCSSAARAVTRSSAISRARASRTSAWTPAARRATSAWRPSGLSWRRISPSRSVSRVRLPSQASSLRSAFSLRLRCLRTPAASSMKPRRSSGVACRIESSWPWPTMTCISRPMPESESSSWTSSSRQGVPLMAYSEPPLRNMVRLIVTSEYSIGSAPSELSMVSSDLGPAQRRAARRAGEDDVLHLAAAQRLGALLAHHPGEGVDDVGLAGAVGPDDAGDARLELERGRGGEGLEPLEGQALQVQRGSLGRSTRHDSAAAGEASRPTLPGSTARPVHPGHPLDGRVRSRSGGGVDRPCGGSTPRPLAVAGELRRRARCGCSWRQMSTTKTAEPTKANQNGAVTPQRWASSAADAGADDQAAEDADRG